jgi:glycine/D-amino acid oxidase-like deaminating enzyme
MRRRSSRFDDNTDPTGAPKAGAVFWLEEALAAEGPAPCSPLAGREVHDICVVGGGYTGLWSALELAELAPELSICVIESQQCGFGASGRNGGWVTSWYDELDNLTRQFGREQAVWLADRTSEVIDELAAFTEAEEIECDLRRRGSLVVAGSAEQAEELIALAAACRAHGRDAQIERLSAEQVWEWTGTRAGNLGALHFRDSATVQPAKLARGLRDAALRRGVTIHEATPMLELRHGKPATVITPAGRIEASQIVLAQGAWLARTRELRRSVVIVGTQIVLTEPIAERPPDPWASGLLLGDVRMFVHYAQMTVDGRMAFGRGGGVIGPWSKVVPAHFADDGVAQAVAADFRAWFPQHASVQLTHAWGGPVDRAPNHLPFVGRLGEGNVHYGLGYSGNGVGPSRLIGRILARQTLSLQDEYTGCALTGGPPAYFPPEPFRSVGGVIVRDAVRRAEALEEQGRPSGRLGRLAKHAAHISLPV